MTLLDIPIWFYSSALSVAGTGILLLLGLVIWFIKRTIRVVDRNTSAIESLDVTMVKMSGNFEKYQATTDGKLDHIEELARIAARDVGEQRVEIIEIKTDIVRLDDRVSTLEKDHEYYHKKR